MTLNAAKPQPVQTRKHYVQHEHIELTTLRSPKTFSAFVGDGYNMALLLHSLLELVGELSVVFYDENPHLSVSKLL
jgi:hypothetical protein